VAYAQDHPPPTTLRVSIDEGPALYREISADLTSFWGHHDSRALHHPMWLRQFVTNAVIARHDNLLIGYLLGTLANPELAYIHLVATRRGYQRRGVGRRLYDTFLTEAASHGVATAEAITTPPNPGSLAFHQQLGFAADLVTDYGGQARTTSCSGSTSPPETARKKARRNTSRATPAPSQFLGSLRRPPLRQARTASDQVSSSQKTVQNPARRTR